MRRCYLVCYDIRDPKRLRRIHKLLRGYGETWQYSIFFCVLTDVDRVRMQNEIEELVNHNEDRAIIVELGPNERSARSAVSVIGQPPPPQESGTVVI